MIQCKDVQELKSILKKLNDASKSLVTNGIEATELHILLNEIDKTVTRGKETIIKDKCLFDTTNLMMLVGKINEVNKEKETKQEYILEFNDRIGNYSIHFDKGIIEIELFRPNRIYNNSRIVKRLVENPGSYIESYNVDEGYLIIRNDSVNKFVVFTSKDGYHFYYVEPSEFCRDKDRV